jgi:hypothetical protein
MRFLSSIIAAFAGIMLLASAASAAEFQVKPYGVTTGPDQGTIYYCNVASTAEDIAKASLQSMEKAFEMFKSHAAIGNCGEDRVAEDRIAYPESKSAVYKVFAHNIVDGSQTAVRQYIHKRPLELVGDSAIGVIQARYRITFMTGTHSAI